MNSQDISAKMNIQDLENLLEQYLPADLYPQVAESIRSLAKENKPVDLWHFRDRATGMYNTRGILKLLDEWRTSCQEAGEQIALLCIDIVNLETIRQIYGNAEGDSVVQILEEMLEDSVSGRETCGHLEGGEFVVIMPLSADRADAAENFLSDIIGRIEHYNRLSTKDYSLHVTNSLSIITPTAELDFEETLGKALAQKDLQRESKEDIFSGYSKQPSDPKEHRLVKEILDKNLFRYAFQPIIDAKTGEIYAYEALMRTAENISLSPLTILKYAMLDGRLYDIERATFFNVLRQLSESGTLGNRKVFINSISNCQLNEKDYKKLRDSYGSLFANMVVEVTEQTEIDDKRLRTLLERSEADGFGLAVDDYGTGYSNTSSLLRYLPNCVKIDRLLITGIQEDPKKQHFVNNIITFAHDNGFLALAEGVETSAELKAVIQMGIDLIQGFYTARPDFTLMELLPDKIKHEIITDKITIHKNDQRKIYIVDQIQELPLMQLALEQYTGIVVAQPELTLIGNPDYTAGITIKIKDGCTCKLTLHNVCMESTEDLPCIDIGNNAHLTLVLMGDNVLSKTGIRVPDGSSCLIKGTGNLSIKSKGIYCYGIGNDFTSGVGSITCRSSGKLEISTDGNHCVSIGGGIYRQGSGIRILCGYVQLNVAGVEAVGIGCKEGSIPIEIQECAIHADFHVASGCAIGCLEDEQNIRLNHLEVNIMGSGNHLCGIGSIHKTGGEITIDQIALQMRMTGQKVRLLGSEGGGLKLDVSGSHMSLNSEGGSVLGIGCMDMSAILKAIEATFEIHLRAAENVAIGALVENCTFVGGKRTLRINQ